MSATQVIDKLKEINKEVPEVFEKLTDNEKYATKTVDQISKQLEILNLTISDTFFFKRSLEDIERRIKDQNKQRLNQLNDSVKPNLQVQK